MITVMGATGNTGKKIVMSLLQAGQKVRALARSRSKLEELKSGGAEVLTGDFKDADFLAGAFRGSDAVYTLLVGDRGAPDYRFEQDCLGEAIVDALRRSAVKYVVALSSIGGELSEKTGLIAGLHAQEERLKQIKDINLCILRPVSFFENFCEALAFIKQAGMYGDAFRPDLAIPMVSTRDIAAAAVQALHARDWKGLFVRELLGPRDLSYAEAIRILGERIGHANLSYVQFPDADVEAALQGAGLSQSFARLYIEMVQAINREEIQPRNGRTRENTTPSRFEDFASELARVYAAM